MEGIKDRQNIALDYKNKNAKKEKKRRGNSKIRLENNLRARRYRLRLICGLEVKYLHITKLLDPSLLKA